MLHTHSLSSGVTALLVDRPDRLYTCIPASPLDSPVIITLLERPSPHVSPIASLLTRQYPDPAGYTHLFPGVTTSRYPDQHNLGDIIFDVSDYLRGCRFLPKLNNELPGERNTTYKERFSSLQTLVLIRFEEDTVLIPRETSWFGYYPDGSFSTVLPAQQTKLYVEDWIGLKTLDEAGRVKFVSVPGNHLGISRADMKKHIVPYLEDKEQMLKQSAQVYELSEQVDAGNRNDKGTFVISDLILLLENHTNLSPTIVTFLKRQRRLPRSPCRFSSARSPCRFSSARSPCSSPPAGSACARLLPSSASISSRSAFRLADLIFGDEIYLPATRSGILLPQSLLHSFVLTKRLFLGAYTRFREGRGGAKKDIEGVSSDLFFVMEQLRRAERKNRDEFRKLMEGHVASGILTAKIHWRDYCMRVKELPAYIAVSSNTSGSTPKDLFEDFEQDTVLIPRETSWFGYYPDGSFSTVLPAQQTKLYVEDWIGLKTLNEAGRVKFVSVPGNHLGISRADMKKHIVPYLEDRAG
ncbi:hypothetical protein ACLOJK_037209 [Asimina triloba]